MTTNIIADYDAADFAPLEMLIRANVVEPGAWMWMHATTTDGERVEHYKHVATREYLLIDHTGHTRGRLLEHQTMPLTSHWNPLPEFEATR